LIVDLGADFYTRILRLKLKYLENFNADSPSQIYCNFRKPTEQVDTWTDKYETPNMNPVVAKNV